MDIVRINLIPSVTRGGVPVTAGLSLASGSGKWYLCNMRARSSEYAHLPWVLALIGFTAVIAQIVLLRELIVVFQGNEMSLGVMLSCWLLWTAVGSGLFGRVVARSRNPARRVAVLQIAVAVAFPATVLAVRAGSFFFGAVSGEILGPGPAFLTSFFVLSVFCVLSGGLFVAGSALYAEARGFSTARSTSAVYLLEAAGSGAGGMLASLLLIRFLSPVEIVLVISALNLVSAVVVGVRRTGNRVAVVAGIIVVFVFGVVPFGGAALESVSQRYLWRGFELVESSHSIYGNLTVTAAEGTETVYQNGVVLFTVPDPAAAEEAVHYAMLQHPAPRTVLLVGGGAGGALPELLEHPTVEHADYVELDPAILRVARERFPNSWGLADGDTRIGIHNVDGRFYLERATRRYDVIIVNLPDPQTAQLNRFYTREFFVTVSRRMMPGGVFSFQAAGAENYIGNDLADFLRCINKTLRAVFPRVVAIPGATVHFFASDDAGALSADPRVLIERLRLRNISAQYVQEHYIPFRVSPDRMQDLRTQIEPSGDTPINADFAPVAYYFNTMLWSTRFHDAYRSVFHFMGDFGFGYVIGVVLLVLVLVVGASLWRCRGERGLRISASGCVFSMGLTTIGLEVLLLLAFQAVYGYVYHQLALLIAAFMGGMALGSWWSARGIVNFTGSDDGSVRAGTRAAAARLLSLQLLVVVFPLLLFGVFVVAARVTHAAGVVVVANVLFPLLAVICGGLGGYQFPLASRVYYGKENVRDSGPGTVYAVDLIGSCLGAAVMSIYFIPVFGFFETAIVIAVINVAPAIVLGISLRSIRTSA